MNNILIFGNGYIMKSFIDLYKHKFNFITINHDIYDINNPDYTKIDDLLINKKVDIIIDSICTLLPISNYNEKNINILNNNIKHVHYVNNLSRSLNVKHILYLSSAGIIYDKKNTSEELYYNNINTLYGFLKIQSECIYKYYSSFNDYNITILRISNVYGNIKYHKSNDNGIINILLKNYKNDLRTTITKSNIHKNYIYISDLCDVICNIMDYNEFECNFNIINVGSSYNYSINDIIKIISKKYKLKLEYNDNKIFNNHEFNININKLYDITFKNDYKSLEYIINTININEI